MLCVVGVWERKQVESLESKQRRTGQRRAAALGRHTAQSGIVRAAHRRGDRDGEEGKRSGGMIPAHPGGSQNACRNSGSCTRPQPLVSRALQHTHYRCTLHRNNIAPCSTTSFTARRPTRPPASADCVLDGAYLCHFPAVHRQVQVQGHARSGGGMSCKMRFLAPSLNWRLARLQSKFEGANIRVVIAFWLFGSSKYPTITIKFSLTHVYR